MQTRRFHLASVSVSRREALTGIAGLGVTAALGACARRVPVEGDAKSAASADCAKELVFAPPAEVLLPVAGSNEAVAVQRVICLGATYPEKNIYKGDLAANEAAEPPIMLLTNATIRQPGQPIIQREYPFTFAGEMVMVIGRGGRNIPVADALDHVFGYAVGIDLTMHEYFDRKIKYPDSMKGFWGAKPVSTIHRAADIGHPQSARIWTAVDGQVVQEGNIADMMWPPPEYVVMLSKYLELRPGDLIFTSNPPGGDPLRLGQTVSCGVDGVAQLECTMVLA